MADSSSAALPDAVFTILVQICGAFAQGADGVFVDDEVILQAREDYTPLIERTVEQWRTIGPFTLALTRSMGKMAAVRALAEGDVTIRVRHYQAARTTMHAFGCPFHIRFPK
jgi:hypothetical protein